MRLFGRMVPAVRISSQECPSIPAGTGHIITRRGAGPYGPRGSRGEVLVDKKESAHGSLHDLGYGLLGALARGACPLDAGHDRFSRDFRGDRRGVVHFFETVRDHLLGQLAEIKIVLSHGVPRLLYNS